MNQNSPDCCVALSSPLCQCKRWTQIFYIHGCFIGGWYNMYQIHWKLGITHLLLSFGTFRGRRLFLFILSNMDNSFKVRASVNDEVVFVLLLFFTFLFWSHKRLENKREKSLWNSCIYDEYSILGSIWIFFWGRRISKNFVYI